MRIFNIALSITLLISPALAQNIESDFDTSYDFSKIKTYEFAPDSEARETLLQNSLNEKRIKTALESELKSNGFVKSDTPDFYISHRISGAPKTRFETRQWPPAGGAPKRARGAAPPPVQIQIPQRYLEGSLIVNFIDRATDQLIWRGFATDPIDPAKPEKYINKAIEKMIKKFMKDTEKRK